MHVTISLAKVILSTLNTLLAMFGVGLIALSVFELNFSMPGSMQRVAAVIQIFVGCAVTLASFLGCFAVCHIISLSLLWTYATSLLVLLAFQLYLIIVTHLTDYALVASMEIDRVWNISSNTTTHPDAMSEIEEKLVCCGRNGLHDYVPLENIDGSRSCYWSFRKSQQADFWIEGCLAAMQRYTTNCGDIGLLVKWSLFAIECLSLGSTYLFAFTIRRQRQWDLF